MICGINVIETTLEYDDSIFEAVQDNSFSMQNRWNVTTNNQKLLMTKMTSGVTNRETLGTVVLKVKNNVSAQDTTIKFKNIETNNGKEIVTGEDTFVELKIKNDPSNDDNNNNNNQGDNNSQNGGNGSNNKQYTNTAQTPHGSTQTTNDVGSTNNANTNQATNTTNTVGNTGNGSNNSTNPKTGDNIMASVTILVVSICGIVAIAIVKKYLGTKE